MLNEPPPPINKERILLIDDEAEIRRAVRTRLQGEGYQVEMAKTGQEGIDLINRWRPDLIILDLMLPDMDGLDACRKIREWSSIPIIVLSARIAEADKIALLDAGADDYLTKPFGSGELEARIRVALRHVHQQQGGEKYETGDLTIDFKTRIVTVAGNEKHLTPTEYAVLIYLTRHVGQIVTHRDILREVWGIAYEDEIHYLHVFIGQLRRKLEPDPLRPTYVLTEPGVGYRLRRPQ
jgi:two-component system KDP operon response regulator KdpE